MNEDIIDRIYEAGVVPDLWIGLLSEITELAGGLGGTLILPVLGRWIATPQISQTMFDLMTSGLISTNERTRRLIALNHPGFVTDQDVFPLEQISEEPVYRDFFIPRGGGFGVATVIPSPSGDTMIFHIERAFADGPIGSETVRLLDSLRPHLARASLLASRMELQLAGAAAAALQMLGLPGAVIGFGGRVIFGNRQFADLLPEVIQDRRARITLTNQKADVLLADALARLGAAGSDQAVSSIPVPLGDRHPPLIVHLVPITGAAHDVFASATAIVVVTLVVPKDVPTAEVVQGLFDLTPAEARVAREIGRGKTGGEIALASGLSQLTVSTQIKAILSKTGLHRQAELVGLLRGLAVIAPPHRGE